jgi:hypothetical protein
MASAKCSEETKECTRRVFEAVSNNSVSLLRSAGKRYSEIQLLTSLIAECNEGGGTPLAMAIKRDYVSVVEAIVEFLKKVLYNTTDEENHLKITFVINQLLHQITIKALIDNVIHVNQCSIGNRNVWLMFIAKIVIKSISLTRQDKIILLELIGASLILHLNFKRITEKEALCGNYGLECWREAMTLRYFPTDGGDLLSKLPNVIVPSVSSSVIFGSAVEVATMEELDLLRQDFQHNYFPDVCYYFPMRIPCAKRMAIQALLVSRRIYAHEHLGHPHFLYIKSVLDFPNVCLFEDNIGIHPQVFIVEELLSQSDSNLVPLESFQFFIYKLRELSDKFVDYLSEPSNSPEGRQLNYANLLIITKWITTIHSNHPIFQNDDCQIPNVLHFVCRLVFVLNSISSRITKEEQQILESFFYDYIREFPERTTTVLHIAASPMYTDPAHLQTIKQILKFGADPNAIDECGETPLHRLAAGNMNIDKSVPLFQVLLDAGAHLDVQTDYGATVLYLLKRKLNGKVHPYFESLINSVLPLSCYCAQVIRQHGIPFEDRLPPRLKKLVSIHNVMGKHIIRSFRFSSEINLF